MNEWQQDINDYILSQPDLFRLESKSEIKPYLVELHNLIALNNYGIAKISITKFFNKRLSILKLEKNNSNSNSELNTPQAETTQAENTQAENTQAENTQAETTQAENTQEVTPQEVTPQVETTQVETTQADTTQAETPQVETTQTKTTQSNNTLSSTDSQLVTTSKRINLLDNDFRLENDLVYLNQDNRKVGKHLQIPYSDTNIDIVYINDREFKKQLLIEQVKRLQKIPQPAQRSPEWYNARKNRITASEAGKIVGGATDSDRKQLLRDKTGYGKPFLGSAATRWGQKYEPVATMVYERDYNTKVIEFGLLPHPTLDIIAASPDGITPEGKMLEIKCPYSRVIDGKPKPVYWVQMQVQLEVACLDICDFLECTFKEYKTREEYLNDVVKSNKTNSDSCSESESNSDSDNESNSDDELDTNELDTNEWESSKKELKGVIGVMKYIEETNMGSKEVYKYVYPKLAQTLDSAEKEARELAINEGYKDEITFDYWRLEVNSCIEVFRDILWFRKVYPEFEKFWAEVVKVRKEGRLEEPDSELNLSDDDIDSFVSKKGIFNKQPKKIVAKDYVVEDFEIDDSCAFDSD